MKRYVCVNMCVCVSAHQDQFVQRLLWLEGSAAGRGAWWSADHTNTLATCLRRESERVRSGSPTWWNNGIVRSRPWTQQQRRFRKMAAIQKDGYLLPLRQLLRKLNLSSFIWDVKTGNVSWCRNYKYLCLAEFITDVWKQLGCMEKFSKPHWFKAT